jgi:hypothetical protein
VIAMNRWGHGGTNTALKELRGKMIGYKAQRALSTISSERA